MESQGQQTSGGGGTETAGEGEDEESSSSSSNMNRLMDAPLRPLLEDENQDNVDDPVQEEPIRKNPSNNATENVLEQFRQQWRDELQKTVSTSKTNSRDASPAINLTPTRKASTPSIAEERIPRAEETVKANMDVFETASRLFQNGIDLERRGQMYDAIRSYRQALQLVPDIEQRFLVSSNAAPGNGGRTYAMVASESLEEKRRAYDTEEQLSMTSEELIEVFRHRLFITNGGKAFCTPADADDEEEDETGQTIAKPSSQQQNGVHISQLPTEVLMNIFKWVISSELDLRQLEQLSMVCGGFYMLARDQELWRLACLTIWGVRLGMVDSVYPSWRHMFIERPHVWYNGVYISKISYVRHGEAAYQDQFYRPWHVVVYYRYLKFFSDGTMIMLTTPEEPSTVVPLLKYRQPRFQGIIKGTYRLVGHDCVAGVLTRKNNTESTSSPYIRNRFVKQPNDLVEHVFSLVLNINSIKRRHHVQLTWSNYEVTARYRNGQTSASKFDLCDQNFPPLNFSRVKSYSAYSEAALQ